MTIIRKYGAFVTTALLTVAVISCNTQEFLEVTPKDQVSDATVWTNGGNADLFLNDIYNAIPELNNEYQPLDQYTDNSHVGANWMWGQTTVATGAIAPNNIPPGPGVNTNGGAWDWNTSYNRIRKTNVFIQNVTASTDLSADYKTKRIAEARFLRAFFYHYLWIAYGGVPLITEVLNNNTQGDEIYKPRSTSDELVKFISDELTAVAQVLPVTQSDADQGRPTKGAALTLKGWVELYNASPLHNTSGDASKWSLAAATNKSVMDLGVYDLLADFGNVWLPEYNNSVEHIFDRQYKAVVKGGRREGYLGPVYVNGAQASWGNMVPTQELVDDFAMDNGKVISDPTSGYNSQNPYAKREQRFYKTILYDGAPWQGDTIRTRRGVGSRNEIDLGSASDVTNTGYYARKTLDERLQGQNNINQGDGGQNYIFFRYAEVLLSYAEAQNEAVGPDASVYAAVNKVRTRSALPALPTGLSKAQMRTAIRRERRVELAFEDKRWYDVLRWKIATDVLNKPIHGMLIERVNGVWTYTPVKVTDKVFTEKMYYMPIPQSALDQNAQLRGHQNPGY